MPRKTPPDRREKILAAAMAEFAAHGYAAARLDDVAARVGISKAALYLQFQDKAALFQAMIDWLLASNLPQAFPPDLAQLAAADQLRFFIAAGISRIAAGEISFLPRLVIGEGGRFPEIAKAYHDRAIVNVLGVLEAIIQRGMAQGEFRPVDAGLAARSIAGGVVLSAIWKTVLEPAGAAPLDLQRMAQSHADLVVAGLRKG
jgi:AcrR family transcriptional regulator